MQIHALMFLNSLFNFFGPKLLHFKKQLQALFLAKARLVLNFLDQFPFYLAYHMIGNSLNK